MSGEYKIYASADSVMESEDTNPNLFPVEFLNSLNLNGVPVHELKLKKGMPVILLRNLDTRKGLCNGTRLIVRELLNNVIDCEVVTGISKGHRVFIPRITCTSLSKQLPFTLKRRQFPIQPCFAMTINKSQGQSIGKVGIFLGSPVFSHGQLYVALSRCKNWNCIKVVSMAEPIKNFVYKDILQ
jgi:ATP-dependent DNA helicase PIF1